MLYIKLSCIRCYIVLYHKEEEKSYLRPVFIEEISEPLPEGLPTLPHVGVHTADSLKILTNQNRSGPTEIYGEMLQFRSNFVLQFNNSKFLVAKNKVFPMPFFTRIVN